MGNNIVRINASKIAALLAKERTTGVRRYDKAALPSLETRP